MSDVAVARLLALIPYLRDRGPVSVAEVAKHFDISRQQVLADIQTLVFCGLPDKYFFDRIDIDIDAAKSEGIIAIRDAEFLPRPTRFTPTEVMALTVALAALRDLAPANRIAAIDSAIMKLRAASGVNPCVEVLVETGDPEILTTVQQAISDSVTLIADYDKPTGRRRIVVEPLRIFTRDGFAYLEGWDVERDEWRYYRLDRFGAAEKTSDRVVPRDPPPLAPDWLTVFADGLPAVLELQPAARWIVEYYPVTSVDKSSEIWQVTLPIVSEKWLTSLLLRLGDAARVVSPLPVLAAARAEAARALAGYAVAKG